MRIAFLSALILFLEMLLVRWVGTEIRVFAYLQNAVLVACLLGLGLGCRNARQPVRLVPAVGGLLGIALLIRDPLGWGLSERITQGLVAFEDSVIWARRALEAGGNAELQRLLAITFSVLATLVVLWTVAYAFHPLGQWLGRWMDAHPRPIAAYTANVFGSLLGIVAFDAVTIAETPPWLWLALSGGGLALLTPLAQEAPRARQLAAALALALPLAAWTPGDAVWSPYQKLSIEPYGAPPRPGAAEQGCGFKLNVNNTGYQIALDLDPATMASRPDLYPPERVRLSHFVLPYALIGPRERALVVGSGTGNDVAAALRAGLRSVDAVEIDPVIVRFGRERHPNRPYLSDRVSVTVDDARAFFRRQKARYDVIWFGALDSHTSPSAYTNVRLDHFVYTLESFEDMKRLLAPGGVVVLGFDPQTLWIADRLVGLLRRVFGTPPVSFYLGANVPCLGHDGLLLIAGAEDALRGIRERAEAEPDLRKVLVPPARWPNATPPTTDDWPYLYLQGPRLPRYHLLVGLICLALGLLLRRRLFRPGEQVNVEMMLLGAGFMLLEVSGVSRAALLFGTTWTVNAYVIAAILGMILLANLVASRWPIRAAGLPFAGLVVSLFLLGLLPTVWLASLPTGARVVAGGAFLALPVFFAGLIFVSLWAASPRKDLALGSNLLGSLVGGVASMLSMVVGFRALSFLTLATYLGAVLLVRRSRGR